jgi:hypothetical protein
MLPIAFNWPLFSVALALMTAPVAHLACRELSGRPPRRVRVTGSPPSVA